MQLKLDVRPRARILAIVNVSDACCQHIVALGQNSESPIVDTAKEISMRCHKTASLGKAEAGDSEVDLDGERRRMLDVCTLRYSAFFLKKKREGLVCQLAQPWTMWQRTPCSDLAREERWSALGRPCATLLFSSEPPFRLGAVVLNVSAEIAWGFVEARRIVQ